MTAPDRKALAETVLRGLATPPRPCLDCTHDHCACEQRKVEGQAALAVLAEPCQECVHMRTLCEAATLDANAAEAEVAALREQTDDLLSVYREKLAEAEREHERTKQREQTANREWIDWRNRAYAAERQLEQAREALRCAKPLHRPSQLGMDGRPDEQQWMVPDGVRNRVLAAAEHPEQTA